MAVGTVFHLEQGFLESIDDAAGMWQYESGTVAKGGVQVGTYMATRRYVSGQEADADNTMFTMTIFFTGDNPPQNLTLQGVWSCQPGGGIGSVSAISEGCEGADGAYFTIDSSHKLTIQAFW